ncbi:MAG: hypothetical protein AB7T31_08920 [Gemmatimonadales bacterium]
MTDPSPALALAARLAGAGGGAVSGIVLYGSQLLGARPGRHSAFDFVVVVDDYRAFYRALSHAGELHRPVWLMTWLAHVLAPNAIAFAPEGSEQGIAKCQIVSRSHFAAALSADPPDHFLLGRLVQRVEIVWARSDDDTSWIRATLARARSGVLAWMLPYLDAPVDAEGLGRRLLEVCYRGELRPEATDRAHRIFDAQIDHFRAIFPEVLERGAREGLLVRDGPGYRPARPVPPAERRRWRSHFARSKTRATLRWFKHMVTFANWLPYIVNKVERHTGRTIRLTTLEKKLPIIFLWPRAIHVLLTRPRREIRP